MEEDVQESLNRPECHVGVLSTYDPQTQSSRSPLIIYSHQDIYVGRDRKRCQYFVDDPVVSKRHLWIYTIIFDPECLGDVPPLVYAQDISLNGSQWNGYHMGRGRGSFLLSHGDVLKISENVSLMYTRIDHIGVRCFNALQQVEMRVFEEQYTITQRKLGSGAHGKVHMAFNRDTGQQLACKIIDLRQYEEQIAATAKGGRSKFPDRHRGVNLITQELKDEIARKVKERLEVYHREAMILETLQHPNIINVEKIIKTRNSVYIFQELVTSGDLFSYIQYKGGKIEDIESAVIVPQILIALEYLHDRSIVHRDLKPDNILMTSRADGCRVVLTDFGCATILRPSIERMSTMVGTFEFSAPEVLRTTPRGYTKAIDLWSLGSVTAVLLTGDPPFEALRSKFYSKENAQERGFAELEKSMENNHIGERARDFVRQLLLFDENARLDVKQALQHSWFTNRSHKDEFEALYRRSIRGWNPRPRGTPISVDLSSYFSTQNNTPNSTQSECSTSRRWSNSDVSYTESSLGGGTPRAVSETLSDPNLPAHGNFEDTKISGSQLQPDLRLNMCSPPPERGGDHIITIPIETSWVSLDDSQRLQDTDNDFDGEVYEVICNEITGKKGI